MEKDLRKKEGGSEPPRVADILFPRLVLGGRTLQRTGQPRAGIFHVWVPRGFTACPVREARQQAGKPFPSPVQRTWGDPPREPWDMGVVDRAGEGGWEGVAVGIGASYMGRWEPGVETELWLKS